MQLKSDELNSVLRGCSDYDTECSGNRFQKEAVDGSGVNLQPKVAGENPDFSPDFSVAKDCIEQNCLRSSAAARFIQMAEMRGNTTLLVHAVFLSMEPADDSGIGKSKHALSRIKRHPHACKDTFKPTRHAVTKCIMWPEFIKCLIKCDYGYAVQERDRIVTKTERNCRVTVFGFPVEPSWYPIPAFPVCQPYINCKTKLNSGGALSCIASKGLDTPASCNISCLADQGFGAIATARYECVDANYRKKLPFCAVPDRTEKVIGYPSDI